LLNCFLFVKAWVITMRLYESVCTSFSHNFCPHEFLVALSTIFVPTSSVYLLSPHNFWELSNNKH